MSTRKAARPEHSAVASVPEDADAYERWLKKQCEVDADGLKAKHKRMSKSAFDFLRATYFRWARTIEGICPSLGTAPQVLAIGDIHVENYGTWRDAEARLVWGINDFDEVAVMPYAFDLVRLAASAALGPSASLSLEDIGAAVLRGYRRGLKTPRPALLDEDVLWLRPYVNPSAKSNREFWKEVTEWHEAEPPKAVRRALLNALPDGAGAPRLASRQKGGGSLGRPRFLALAAWNGGSVVREAKALVPSAWDWAHGAGGRSRLRDAAFGTYRSPDPTLHVAAGFMIRRVAPDARKIDIEDMQMDGLTEDLIAAMAAELAAVHAGSKRTRQVLKDLDERPGDWLQQATALAVQAVQADFEAYCAYWKKRHKPDAG